MTLLVVERAVLEQYCAWVRERFPGRVRALTLFGSRARGEGNEESDLDLLVAIEALTSAEAHEARQMAGDALTHHDILLSPLVMSWERFQELRSCERLITREIERDGVPL
jgi:predicted nucleotidyltransferase